MKVVILAGGLGTRLGEETNRIPKPMVEIGGMPILWHIMKIYATYGHKDFVICCGYKGDVIKDWFASHLRRHSDITFDFRTGEQIVHRSEVEDWRVTCVDTGQDTKTAGRVLRVRSYLDNEPFFLTYGDGLANINIGDLLRHHKQNDRALTMSRVIPPPRFGTVEVDGDIVTGFREKNTADSSMTNGGFFVCEPSIFQYIGDDADDIMWEDNQRGPMVRAMVARQLSAYRHDGFWRCMDTLPEKVALNELWAQDRAPWRIWDRPRLVGEGAVRTAAIAGS